MIYIILLSLNIIFIFASKLIIMNRKNMFLFLALLPMIFFTQQKVSIIPSVGYSWRLGEISSNIPADFKNHIKGLKNGVQFDVSTYYNINSSLGIGLKYNQFRTSNTSTVSLYDPYYNTTIRGMITNKDRISYIGAGIIYSNFSEETRHKFYYDITLGVISYKSNITFIDNSTIIKGSTLGLSGNLSYMYAFSPKFFIGPQLGTTLGVLKNIKVDGEKTNLGNEKESLYRISLGVGATINL